MTISRRLGNTNPSSVVGGDVPFASNSYSHLATFITEVQQVFDNATLFNREGEPVYNAAVHLRDVFHAAKAKREQAQLDANISARFQ